MDIPLNIQQRFQNKPFKEHDFFILCSRIRHFSKLETAEDAGNHAEGWLSQTGHFCCGHLIRVHVFTYMLATYRCEGPKPMWVGQYSMNDRTATFSSYSGLPRGRKRWARKVQTSKQAGASQDTICRCFHNSKTLGLLTMDVFNARVKTRSC